MLFRRYFFDLTNGLTTIPDVDGVLAANDDDAIAQAEILITELRIIDEQIDTYEGWTLNIRDDAGGELKMLPVVPHV